MNRRTLIAAAFLVVAMPGIAMAMPVTANRMNAAPPTAPPENPKGYVTTVVTGPDGQTEEVKTEVNYRDLRDTLDRHKLRVQQAQQRLGG